MTMLAVTAALSGVILGLRFKVLILIPAIVISLVAILGIGTANGYGHWSIVLAVLIAITELQMGYLAGAFVRFAVTRVRARKQPLIVVVQRR